jgi:phospholipid/cholesterol/gamma-HCH transport system ATP-binding protein
MDTAATLHGRESVISVRDLVTHYGDRPILKGVSLEVHAGEIMVIMGGSGSGKSTLLRHVMALETATSGSIRICGADVCTATPSQLREVRKKLGVAFQSGALFSSMTVGENIMLPMVELAHLDRWTMRIMARLKLELVGLAGFEALLPAQLSGGMVKRAALARALALDPRILLCDEPSSGLDPAVASAIDDLLLQLRDSLGTTIVVVTHDLDSAFKIADRITVLGKGDVLFVGTKDDLQSAQSERIQNLLNRRPEEEQLDPDAYLARLTGDDDAHAPRRAAR